MLNPNVNGVVYKWWHRTTPEGEEIPVRVDPINLHYIGEVNMLPVFVIPANLGFPLPFFLRALHLTVVLRNAQDNRTHH